jgi:hypothetical protein
MARTGYRMGQTKRVTVEYFVADRTLDGYIVRLMHRKLALLSAVESDDLPDPGLPNQICVDPANLAPAPMQEPFAGHQRECGDAPRATGQERSPAGIEDADIGDEKVRAPALLCSRQLLPSDLRPHGTPGIHLRELRLAR